MTDASPYRPGLPPDMPARVRALPVHRGYPVPWFVQWTDAARPTPIGEGVPDFRLMRPDAIAAAVRWRTCWICGGAFPVGAPQVFMIGPMCAVNRVSSEPPSHPECADWSARACPFLARPNMERREGGLPGPTDEPAGIMIRRNPGVSLLWASPGPAVSVYAGGGGWTIRDVPNGILFDVGEPLEVRWYAEGRVATRAEIMRSIETGLPTLRRYAEMQAGGVEQLETQLGRAMELVPA